MNRYMEFAKEFDFPVQFHTGYPSGPGDELAKTNAIHLTSLINRHPDVKFEMMHANLPYDGEVLFLAKNYPNVHVQFSWANVVDPLYCQNLMRRLISHVPHCKVHAFGADLDNTYDCVWSHSEIAKDNVAIALSDLVEMNYLDLNQAKRIAKNWFFDNPNEFFKIGLE